MSSADSFDSLPRAFELSPGVGRFRELPEDFRVDELEMTEPTGDGQHVWLNVEKMCSNTEWVARELANLAGVRVRDVGYAGMKDRYAITTQWFSVDLQGRPEPDWGRLCDGGFIVKKVTRHRRKLRRGELRGNRFRIRLRGFGSQNSKWLSKRMEVLSRHGLPNYFGPQRFGVRGSNLERAREVFRGSALPSRYLLGIYLSAARAQLFNMLLSARVKLGVWAVVVPGDAVLSPHNARAFLHHRCREAREGRLESLVFSGSLHPSGPLWGRGLPPSVGYARALELRAVELSAELRAGLESYFVGHDRRSLRVMLNAPAVTWMHPPNGDDVVVEFSLSKGAYATAVLRELARSPPQAGEVNCAVIP